jgi:hypothetical protein
MICDHSQILFRCKKNENLSFATTFMELEITILSEISEAQKEKYYMIFVLTHTCYLKKLIASDSIIVENEMVVTREKGE